MISSKILLLLTLLLALILFGCEDSNTGTGTVEPDPVTFEGSFQASGNTSQFASMGDLGDNGPFPAQVEVTFNYSSLLKMRFCPPAMPVLVSENGIEYSNGYAETYDPETGYDGSFEVFADFSNKYATMWIENKNDARIVVRWKAALVEGETALIAHAEDYSGAPYGGGNGDWVDEYFYIYPDAVRTRYSKIYTAFANASRPFGFQRNPPNYVHEFFEMILWTYKPNRPTDELDINALTLVNMNGHSADISYSPYPQYPGGFGAFETSNIILVNLKAQWKPFVIGNNHNVTIRPYAAESNPNPFQTWDDDESNVQVTALGHMVNWTHYERTQNTISQLYLEGLINTSDPGKDLSDLAKSWLTPPDLVIEGGGYSFDAYKLVERAYHITRTNGDNLAFSLNGSSSQPVVRPAIVINNWGENLASSIGVNGTELEIGTDVRQGLEENNLVIWLNQESYEPVNISVIR